jgi:hypothetical protein
MRLLALSAAVLVTAVPSLSHAWTRPGHMVSAAIAYEELAARNPAALRRLLAIAAAHPDRGPFEVAIGRATGADRDRRVFMELARWPDDIRGGPHDHPTWHYALTPVSDPRQPPSVSPPNEIVGAAREAFALNVKVASDPKAPPADRALALGWIFHVAGDIHQPLHTVQLFSRRFPSGDRGGALQYVKDPQTGETISLHWLWDDSVNRDGEAPAAVARAGELTRRHPRAGFPELKTPARAEDFSAWAVESYRLAAPIAYRADLSTSDAGAPAPEVPQAYQSAMTAAAERRLTLAGYRLANIAEQLVAAD